MGAVTSSGGCTARRGDVTAPTPVPSGRKPWMTGGGRPARQRDLWLLTRSVQAWSRRGPQESSFPAQLPGRQLLVLSGD